MATGNENRVAVTDISMPFGSMVVFMIKWALASIPAMVILFCIWLLLLGAFSLLGLAAP